MSTQIQRRRGTTAEHSTFTGVEGELTIDTTKDTAVVHDGTTVGGHPLQKQYPALGSASTPTYTFTGDTNTGIYSPGADQVAISTAGSGRVFVGPSGLVQVGTTTYPSSSTTGLLVRNKIAVSDGEYEYLQLTPSPPTIVTQGDYSNLTLGTNGTYGNLLFRAGNQERLRITSSGLVGVGTSAPTSKLYVVAAPGASSFDGITLNNGVKDALGLYTTGASYSYGSVGGNQSWIYCNHGDLNITSDDTGVIKFSGDVGVERMRLDASGRLGIGTTSATKKLQVEDTSATSTSPFANVIARFVGAASNGDSNIQLSNGVNASANIGIAGGANLYFGLDGVERARIDSSGRLLVGTSSTSGVARTVIQGYVGDNNGLGLLQLQVGSTSPGFTLGRIDFTDSNSNSGARFLAERDGGTWTSGSSHPTRLVFSTTADGASSPTEALRIDRNQDVCIGSANSRTSRVCIESVADVRYLLTLNDLRAGAVGANTCLQFMRESTQVGGISTTSSATAYNTSSDYRLKENVTTVTDGITRLQQLKPSRFNFIADPAKTVDGFLAHEAAEVVPECVTGEKDAVDDDGNPVYQGIDQSKLVPLLTAALQEAIGEIESLKARLTAAGI